MSWGARTHALPVLSPALLCWPPASVPPRGAPTPPHSLLVYSLWPCCARLLRRSWQLLPKVPGFLVGGFVSDPLHGQTLSLTGDVFC